MKMFKNMLFYITMLSIPSISFAEEIIGIDQKIDQFFTTYFGWFASTIFYGIKIEDGVTFPLIVGWLLVAAIVFTFYFGFIQFRKVGLALDIVRGKFSNPDKKEPGEVSHFQALTTALSGTVGLGNIAGVGVAIAIGGAGATFWMIVCGLFGMASKFTECTLGVKYRNENPDGTVSGGPMYYLSKAFKEKGHAKIGRVLAVGFAIMTIFAALGAGNMFQGNQANAMIVQTFGVDAGYGWVTGIIFAVLVAGVIIGGMPSIGSVTSKLVPFMATLYLGMALIVLISHYDQIGAAFEQIFVGAFTGAGVAGGFIGALIQGLKRATFSNEAGVGSAAIAHSAVKTKEPITEGFVSLLEPFIDTVVICTMTALVIIISGMNTGELSGVTLTAAAFSETSFIFEYILALAVIMFAFSTMISWSYYGLKAWTYLFGEGKTTELAYKGIFCLFVIVGTSISFSAVIDFSDAAMFAMSIFNIIGLYYLMPIVKDELKSFIARVDSGEIKKYS
ncbi:alanine/glycine:cation symporter family protein [Poseidonibacter sp. 1_MG-2023]|uniref:alanine/glycine:cation symporter family protein n=1 Tax=Poseidonibacter TaxID=2321187 RepID=UPI001E39EF89|nr:MULTISPECIES: alanine/glycine:cation symporter family protein [Poseidonibacter]MDO6826453.1 alanine/glycine:cation symporter family protein [Poseidonibacter sp. 1_MG-2023]